MAVPWYVLEDGQVVPPDEITLDALGVRRHTSGVPVGMSGDVPHLRYVAPPGINPEKLKRDDKEMKPEEKKPAAPAKDMKPEDTKGAYVTRETKAAR